MDEVLMRSAAGDGVMRDRRKTSIPIATRAVRACDRLVSVNHAVNAQCALMIRSLF
jgi:hypothetical protein